MLKLFFFISIVLCSIIHFGYSSNAASHYRDNFLKNAHTFDWILDRDNSAITSAATVIDLDVIDTKKSTVQKLIGEGKTVIGYINVGSIEIYRDDFSLFPKEVVGGIYPGWEDERFLDIRKFEQFQSFIIHRLDMAKEKGFHGIEPDNMDTYNNSEETGFSISISDSEKYLIWFTAEVHRRGMFVLQKNAPELSISLEKYFDGALLEGAVHNNLASHFTQYITNNKPVFNVEYTDNTTVKYFKKVVCRNSKELGFISILKKRNLDSFIDTCLKKHIILSPSDKKIVQKLGDKLAHLSQKTQIQLFQIEKRIRGYLNKKRKLTERMEIILQNSFTTAQGLLDNKGNSLNSSFVSFKDFLLYPGYQNNYLSKKSPLLLAKNIFKFKTQEKIVYLSFDDGPYKKSTLEYFKKNNIPATFFLICNRITKDNIGDYKNNIFSIGAHTLSHKNYDVMTYDEIESDITQCKKIFNSHGLSLSKFRPAFGIINDNELNILEKYSIKNYLWNIDSLDWNRNFTKKHADAMSKATHGGDIILFHENVNLQILDYYIKLLEKRGFSFGKL